MRRIDDVGVRLAPPPSSLPLYLNPSVVLGWRCDLSSDMKSQVMDTVKRIAFVQDNFRSKVTPVSKRKRKLATIFRKRMFTGIHGVRKTVTMPEPHPRESIDDLSSFHGVVGPRAAVCSIKNSILKCPLQASQSNVTVLNRRRHLTGDQCRFSKSLYLHKDKRRRASADSYNNPIKFFPLSLRVQLDSSVVDEELMKMAALSHILPGSTLSPCPGFSSPSHSVDSPVEGVSLDNVTCYPATCSSSPTVDSSVEVVSHTETRSAATSPPSILLASTIIMATPTTASSLPSDASTICSNSTTTTTSLNLSNPFNSFVCSGSKQLSPSVVVPVLKVVLDKSEVSRWLKLHPPILQKKVNRFPMFWFDDDSSCVSTMKWSRRKLTSKPQGKETEQTKNKTVAGISGYVNTTKPLAHFINSNVHHRSQGNKFPILIDPSVPPRSRPCPKSFKTTPQSVAELIQTRPCHNYVKSLLQPGVGLTKPSACPNFAKVLGSKHRATQIENVPSTSVSTAKRRKQSVVTTQQFQTPRNKATLFVPDKLSTPWYLAPSNNVGNEISFVDPSTFKTPRCQTSSQVNHRAQSAYHLDSYPGVSNRVYSRSQHHNTIDPLGGITFRPNQAKLIAERLPTPRHNPYHNMSRMSGRYASTGPPVIELDSPPESPAGIVCVTLD